MNFGWNACQTCRGESPDGRKRTLGGKHERPVAFTLPFDRACHDKHKTKPKDEIISGVVQKGEKEEIHSDP